MNDERGEAAELFYNCRSLAFCLTGLPDKLESAVLLRFVSFLVAGPALKHVSVMAARARSHRLFDGCIG